MTIETRTSNTRRRAPRAIAAAFALGLAVAVAGALPASAHTQVSPASPEPGSTVTTGPVTVALNTTEPILASGQKSIVVQGPGDEELYYGDGCTEVSNGMTLSSEVSLGEPGEYTVIWTLVAEDGHTQSSNDFEPFTFTWQPDDGQETVAGQTSVPTCGEEPPADSADEGATQNGTTENGASGDDTAESNAAESDTAEEDIAWLIAAAGIIFIVVAAVVMISVRRRMLADDPEATPDSEDDSTGDARKDSSREDPPSTS